MSDDLNHGCQPSKSEPARRSASANPPRDHAVRDLELTLLPQLIVLLDAMPAARWAALEQARNYVRRISTRQFGSADFEQLPEPQLQQLCLTVADRVRTRREQLGISPAELDRRAGCVTQCSTRSPKSNGRQRSGARPSGRRNVRSSSSFGAHYSSQAFCGVNAALQRAHSAQPTASTSAFGFKSHQTSYESHPLL